jgi:hypothetical protein
MQSLVIIPILQNHQLPVQHVAMPTKELLERSESFFRPLNIACEFSNLICIIPAFLSRKTSTSAAEKLPFLGIAWAICLMMTAYVLRMMLPLNERFEKRCGGVGKGSWEPETGERVSRDARAVATSELW